MMIRNTISYTVRSDLMVFGTYIEYIYIEIGSKLIRYETNIIIGTVYRPPPADIKEFNESRLAYIMGDYNINSLNIDKQLENL